MCNEYWGKFSPVIMHLVCAGMAFGQTLAPIIIMPFINPEFSRNHSMEIPNFNHSTYENGSTNGFVVDLSNHIGTAYYIFSGISIFMSATFIIMLVLEKYNKLELVDNEETGYVEIKNSKHYFFPYIFVAIFSFCISEQHVYAMVIPDYISRFGENSYKEGAMMSTFVGIVFAISRVVNIFIAHYFGTALPILIGVFLANIGSLLLLINCGVYGCLLGCLPLDRPPYMPELSVGPKKMYQVQI